MAGLVLLVVMFLIMILMAVLEHLRSLKVIMCPSHHCRRLNVEDIIAVPHHFRASLCAI